MLTFLRDNFIERFWGGEHSFPQNKEGITRRNGRGK